MSPLDLHVLGTPPAFVLSQDQTLVFNPSNAPRSLSVPDPHLNSLESSLSIPCAVRVTLCVRGARAVPLFLRVSLLCIVFQVRSALSRPALSDPLASELG